MSVDLRGNVFMGVGARNPDAGLNWLYGGIDATQLGVSGLRFLRGETLSKDDQVQLRFQAEAGNLDRIPGIGPLLSKIVPAANQADAGAVFRVTVSGDGKGGVEIRSIDGFVFIDIPNNNGLVNISNGKTGPGTRPDQGFTNATTGFKWTPEKGLEQTNNNVLNGQIIGLFRRDPHAVDINALVFNGWSVMGITNNDNSNALTPALQNQLGRLSSGKGSFSNQIISGAVGAGQIVNFFNDVKTSLDGKTVEIVKESPGGIAYGQAFSTTALSVTQGVISNGSPIGLFLRVQGSITATKDGKDDINLIIGGKKIGSTTMGQVQHAGNQLFSAMSNIPGLGGLSPNRAALPTPNPMPSRQNIHSIAGVSQVKARRMSNMPASAAEFIKQGWVGCDKTHKQLIYGVDMKSGHVLVKDDAGKVLGTYAPGTTKSQIQSSMQDPYSQLYGKGAQYDPDDGTRSPVLYKMHPVGCPETRKQLLYATDWHSDELMVIDGHNMKELARYPKGTTKEQIQSTMKDSSSKLYGKGQEYDPPTIGPLGFVKYGYAVNRNTLRKLIYGIDILTNKVLVLDGLNNDVLAHYHQGTTKLEIESTMENPSSPLYQRGELYIPTNILEPSTNPSIFKMKF